jgi:hypothetical protein
MKKLFLSICLALFTIIAIAQAPEFAVINVKVPGTINLIFYWYYDMKVTGNINASDFRALRDNVMVNGFLDLSEATINEYNGWGPSTSILKLYPANELPEYSFYNPNILYNPNPYQYVSPTTAVILPNNLISIGSYAFYRCPNLTEMTIPNTVTTIGKYAFSECSGLTSITLGSSVSSLDTKALFWCKKIKTITCLAITPPQLADESISWLDALEAIYVPASAVAAYKASKWGTLYYRIIYEYVPNALTGINSGVKVYATQSEIVIEGSSPKETVTLYNITGKQLKTVVSSGEKLTIPVDKQGIYLVKIGGKTYKVVTPNPSR